MKFFWGVTVAATILAGLILVEGLRTAKGAPQEAAAAAVALCVAVIPYIFTRAIEAFATADWREKLLGATERSNSDFKSGVQSLWQQLDAIRSAQVGTAQQPQPQPEPQHRPVESVAASLTRQIGKCPNCGKQRSLSSERCESCGSTKPAELS